MEILDEIITCVKSDSPVRQVFCGIHWTAVVSRYCGLSSTFQDPPPHRPVRDVGGLTGKTALDLVEYARSDSQVEASIGMAALNSLLDVDEDRCDERNAYEILVEKGKGKNVAIIGHFPFVPKLRNQARNLWVLEKNPREGDLPAGEAETVLPSADVVGITGTAFINHTVDRLLRLCRKAAWVMLVGATTPFCPVLFDYGVDMIAGSKVMDAEKAIRCISEGATFRQIKGVRHLIMKK
ncbi:MAG: hypothetical protein DRH37_11140 [Deltaproteobacteria bacterium]|nr:MAG: hypothetical protein DRH37_11140 [Deltaproteobacteria bacterium]